MLPLCADEGISTIPWSPLARGRLTAGTKTTERSRRPFASMLYNQEESDRAIIDAVGTIASAASAGPSRARMVAAQPVVAAPIVGASKPSHLATRSPRSTSISPMRKYAALEAPYTPRFDFQGISDNAAIRRTSAQLGIEPARS